MLQKEVKVNQVAKKIRGFRLRLIAFVAISTLIWVILTPPEVLTQILLITDNEFKLLLLYLIGVFMLSLSENLLILISAFFVTGFLFEKIAGIFIFISLSVVLLKYCRSLLWHHRIDN